MSDVVCSITVKVVIYYYIRHHQIINSEASVLEQHVTVVAAGGGASLHYFTISQFKSNGSQPRGGAPPKGQQINVRGGEMINGRGKKSDLFSNLWLLLKYWII